MKRFAAKFLFDWYQDPVTGDRCFVALMQLMELGAECAEGEVWWEFRRRRMTIGQAKARLLPANRALYVFTDGQQTAAARRGPSRRRQHAASRPTNRSSRRPRRARLSA